MTSPPKVRILNGPDAPKGTPTIEAEAFLWNLNAASASVQGANMIVRLGVLVALSLLTTADSSADEPVRLHCVDAQTPEGLRRLFRYDGQRLPLVSAHRGGAQPGYPENCIATFEHTISKTWSMLEIDLRFTKDGQIVLHHDATLDRTTTGTGPVDVHTLEELRLLRLKDLDGQVTDHQMPTLDEALKWARGKTIVVLDKKKVPVEVCVQKIQEHNAQAYAMIMAYSFDEIRKVYALDPDIMMEVMIGDEKRLNGFDNCGVPWDRVIAFVGHQPPENRSLIEAIHSRGAMCMAGTSRNLDKQLLTADGEMKAALRPPVSTAAGLRHRHHRNRSAGPGGPVAVR